MATAEDRLRAFPHIATRLVNGSAEPYLPGTGLAVWEIVWLWRGYEGDIDKLVQHLHLLPITRTTIDEALRYARAHPEEVDPVVEDVETMTAERLQERFPQMRVLAYDPGPLEEPRT